MALDRDKVFNSAQKYLQKGNVDRALAEYQKLAADDPKDARVWLRIGDLLARKGERGGACDAYLKVGAIYSDGGFFLKAVAVYKQITKLDASRLVAFEALAQMYQNLDLPSDALAVMMRLAEQAVKLEHFAEAERALRRICEVEPSNLPARVRLAECLSRLEKTEAAADEFDVAARILLEQQRFEDYAKVAERLLFHSAHRIHVARQLAEIYLQLEQPKKALAKLHIAFRVNPQEPVTLQLLATAFEQLGQFGKSVSVLKELARVHLERGDRSAQSSCFDRILLLDPSDAEALQALGKHTGGVGDEALLDEVEEIAFEELEVVNADDALGQPSRPSASAKPAPRGAGASRPPEGTQSTASSNRQDAQVSAPPRVPAQRSESPLEAGLPSLSPSFASRRSAAPVSPPEEPSPALRLDPARMLGECEVFLRYGLKKKARDHLEALLRAAPDHVDARTQLKDLLLEMGEFDPAVFHLRELAELLDTSAPGLAQQYREQAEALGSPDSPTFSDGGDIVIEATEPVDARVARADAELDALGVDLPLKSISPAARLPERPQVRVSAAPAVPQVSLVEEALDEADFFMAQGLFDAAHSAITEVSQAHPNNPLLQEKLEEIRELMMSSVLTEDSTYSAVQLDDIDPFGSAPVSVDETIREDDSDFDNLDDLLGGLDNHDGGVEVKENHFDLGIAYREMGLFDEAIQELELAIEAREAVCSARMLIGLCYRDAGNPQAALLSFSKGLDSLARTRDETLALYYEVASLHLDLEQLPEALVALEEILAIDATYRDARSIYDQLRRKL